MRDRDFLKRLAFDLVLEPLVKGHGGIPGMKHHPPVAPLSGQALRVKHQLGPDSFALEAVVHRHLPHLDVLGRSRSQDQATNQMRQIEPRHMDIPNLFLKVLRVEIQTQWSSQYPPPKLHRLPILRRPMANGSNL